jgi:hypothetical protein
MNGYLHNTYAQSLSDYGETVYLTHSKGYILKRRIPDFDYYDAMGIYPLFVCERWDKLFRDLEEIKNELVCISIVTDPFGEFDKNVLKSLFSDAFCAFKEHFIIDLSQNLDKIISKHHWRNIKKAQKKISVEICGSPKLIADDWIKLYKHLIKAHNIKGIPAFSERALAQQLEVPGVQIFRGINEGETVAMLVWYIIKNIVYYHLGASSDRGYGLNASFALFSRAIEYFSSLGLDWINLGAGAGANTNRASGLARFKKGWSSGTKQVYFCGRIFNAELYNNILKQKNMGSGKYFPAYRKGEFP